MYVLRDDAVLLGAPVGGNAAIESVLKEKLSELWCLTHRLSTLHAHDAFYLLIHCFSMPKLQYTLRSAPCFAYELLGQYDCVIQASLMSLLSIDLNGSSFALNRLFYLVLLEVLANEWLRIWLCRFFVFS
jgi:hypothetical protein